MPPFLSDDWFTQAAELRKEYADIPVPPAAQDLQVNLLLTGGPGGDTEAHLARPVTADWRSARGSSPVPRRR